MSYSLHRSAERDLTDAFRFYKAEAGRGVAGRFLNEFERVVRILEEFPDIGTPTNEGRRTYPEGRQARVVASAPARSRPLGPPASRRPLSSGIGHRQLPWRGTLLDEVTMPTIEVMLPEDVYLALRRSPGEVARDVRVAAAVEWYAEGLVSQGKASELAGLSRPEFLDELAKRKVPVIQMTVEELRAELAGE